MHGQAAEDFRDLPRRLSLAEDHLRHALAEGAMVVDFGKAEVLKGQVAQALDGFIGRQFPLSHLLKQLAQGR
jgi:hypothetical protein